jgi:hypothetical protein
MLKTKLTLFAIVFAATALCSSADTVIATFGFSQDDLVFTEKDGGGYTYDYVYMPGGLQSTTPGAPLLPVVNAALAVPWGATVNSVAVTDSAYEPIEGEYYLYPTQEPEWLEGGDASWTAPDEEIYGADEAYPGTLLDEGGTATTRGHLLYLFALTPLQYTGADEELKLYTTIEVTLDYTPPGGQAEPTRMEVPEIYDAWTASVKGFAGNPDYVASFREPVIYVDCTHVVEKELPGGQGIVEVVEMAESEYYQYNYPPEEGPQHAPPEREFYYPYVIITNNYWHHDGSKEYVGNLESVLISDGVWHLGKHDLGKLKQRKGWPVAVISLDGYIKEKYTEGDIQDKIHAFLNDAYDHWATAFVLFAGDVEKPVYYEQPSTMWKRSGRYGVVPVRHLCPHPQANFNPASEYYIYNEAEVKICPGDIYYACLDEVWDGNDNDIHGQMLENEVMTFGQEILVGRVPLGIAGSGTSVPDPENEVAAASENEARAFQEKLYKYEVEPVGLSPPPSEHLDEALVMGADFVDFTERFVDDGYLQGFTVEEFYEEGGSQHIEYPRRKEPHEVVEKLSNNFGITLVNCHGAPFALYEQTHRRGPLSAAYGCYIQSTPAKRKYLIPGHYYLTFPAGLDELENAHPGILYALSCSVNRYDYEATIAGNIQEDGVAEVYILQPDHGGAAFFGTTRSAERYSGEGLAVSFFKELFKYSTPTNPNDGNFVAGSTEAKSKLEYAGDVTLEQRFAAFTHDLNGEPEFSVYTDDPHFFNVTYHHPVTLSP